MSLHALLIVMSLYFSRFPFPFHSLRLCINAYSVSLHFDVPLLLTLQKSRQGKNMQVSPSAFAFSNGITTRRQLFRPVKTINYMLIDTVSFSRASFRGTQKKIWDSYGLVHWTCGSRRRRRLSATSWEWDRARCRTDPVTDRSTQGRVLQRGLRISTNCTRTGGQPITFHRWAKLFK